MDTYKCEICNKIFEKKSLFDNHKNRKTPCKNLNKGDTDNKITEYKCDQCEQTFALENSLNAHMRHECKIKKDISAKTNEQLMNEIQDLKKTINQMQEEHKKLCRVVKKLQIPKCESYVQNNTLKLVVQEEEFELWNKQYNISRICDGDVMDERMKDFVKSTIELRMNFPSSNGLIHE